MLVEPGSLGGRGSLMTGNADPARPTGCQAGRHSLETHLALSRPSFAVSGTTESENRQGPTRPDRLWLVNPFVGGHWCAFDISPAGFWRADSTRELRFTLSRGRDVAVVRFRKGKAITAWPTLRASSNHEPVLIRFDSGLSREFLVHTMVPGASTKDLATQLARLRCFHQLSMLLPG